MAFFVRKFLSNLFISIMVEESNCKIYGKSIKNGKILRTFEAIFDLEDPNLADEKLIDYIKRQEKTAHSTYIAMICNGLHQGALPFYGKEDYEKFGLQAKSLNIVNMHNFSVFSNQDSILSSKKFLGNIGIDLLYSPFVLLYEMVKNHNFSEHNTLFCYLSKENLTLMVFNKQNMKFGAFFKMKNANMALENPNLTNENIDEIDEILDMQDGFFEIGDLENLDEIANFEDNFHDFNTPKEIIDLEESVANSGIQTIITNCLNQAICEYYQNPLYDSDFIQDIVIFDNSKASKTLLSAIETEMLINASMLPVDGLKIMSEIMVRELKL